MDRRAKNKQMSAAISLTFAGRNGDFGQGGTLFAPASGNSSFLIKSALMNYCTQVEIALPVECVAELLNSP